MKQESEKFLEKTHEALIDPQLQQNLSALSQLLPAVRDGAMRQFGQFEELRAHVKNVRDHTLAHHDHYLKQFEEQVILNGGHVHWAADSEELNNIVLDLCRQHHAQKVGKGKSMITEETGLLGHLESAGLDVVETDLGEYIIQIAGETPSHIVGPALHKSADEVRDLFLDTHDLGERELPDPPAMVQEARTILRQKFLEADIGIIGSNALIAENGSTMLVTNEGNGDLLSTLPKVQIVCASIEKVLPRPEDATALSRLLARSAVAIPISCYTSFYSGPKRNPEDDGPEEFHVVLLDNRRRELIGSNYQDMLTCMRCGACLNHCPIYMAAGGHSYGWVYPGPMGSVLTPLLTSLESSHALPNACTTCGRCAEVCPASIPLPDLLRDLRAEEREQGLSPWRWRWGIRAHALLARFPRVYQFATGIAIRIMHMLGRREGVLHELGIKNGWTEVRDFPSPQGQTFMQQWKKRRRNG